MPKQIIKVRITCRDVDLELWRGARKSAITQGVTLGVWLNQAIAAHLGLWDKSRKG